MVAIDSAQDFTESRQTQLRQSESGHTATIVMFALLGSALLVASSVLFDLGFGSGWHVAAEMVARFSLFLFVAAMSVEPLARLLPFTAVKSIGRERASLTMAFAASSGVALLCVIAPSQFGGEAMSAPAVAYCILTGAILVVMLFSAHPATALGGDAPAWRAVQRISTSYFWIVFALTGMEHLVGPHRPENWYGFSLLLLVATLLLRFADSFVAHWRDMAPKRGMAGKVA